MDAYHRVLEFWWKTGWPVIPADSDTEIFSLSQARNNAVAQAKTDVVVICDADTIPDMTNIRAAVADPVGVCWPFTKYRVLAPEYLDVPFKKLADVPYLYEWGGDGANGVGGCLVATTREYWRLGGQDPAFIGWGHEDTAFTFVVETLSTLRRSPGNIYAFEHNTSAVGYTGAKADSPGWDRDYGRNEALMVPYRTARHRAWLMREVIKNRTGQDPLGDAPNRGDPELNKALLGRYKP
jgi:glycosyltransferase involved in cell wall biosynthesis